MPIVTTMETVPNNFIEIPAVAIHIILENSVRILSTSVMVIHVQMEVLAISFLGNPAQIILASVKLVTAQ